MEDVCKVDGFALWGEWGFMGVVASVGVEVVGQRRKERTEEDKEQKLIYLARRSRVSAFPRSSQAPLRHHLPLVYFRGKYQN